MTLRALVGSTLVAALLMGCGAQAPVDETVGELKLRCPDPSTDCTVNNGAGIYTEEYGFAGIGPTQFMITHFINLTGGGVNLQGRYFLAATDTWQVEPGAIYYANYGTRTHLRPISVSESLTNPTWTLFDPGTSTYITVAGADLLNLQLVITFNEHGTSALYTLLFDSVTTDSDKASIRKYNMLWRSGNNGTGATTQYCFRADGSSDQVVFQQDIIVNPGNANVTRDANYVTLSCRYGAPATVRMWGYPYRIGYATYYFDAGLHMKRASYCGDGDFYTESGTKIRVHDDAGVQTDPIPELEAWWTPKGAACVNMANRRHMDIPFSGSCNGVPLPPCTSATVPQHLADGPE